MSKNIKKDEAILEKCIAANPSLLNNEECSKIIHNWNEQMRIDGVGIPDLLFIDHNSLPVIVEVKLWKNAESKRKIIGQIFDYASYFNELADNRKEKLELLTEQVFPNNANWGGLRANILTNLEKRKYRLILAFDQINFEYEGAKLMDVFKDELLSKLSNKYNLLRILKYLNTLLKIEVELFEIGFNPECKNIESKKIEIEEEIKKFYGSNENESQTNPLIKNYTFADESKKKKVNNFLNQKVKHLCVDLLSMEDIRSIHKNNDRSESWELFEEIKKELPKEDISFLPIKYKDNPQVTLFYKGKIMAYLHFYKYKRIIQLRIPLPEDKFKTLDFKDFSIMSQNRMIEHFKGLYQNDNFLQAYIIKNCEDSSEIVKAIKLAVNNIKF